MEALFRHVADAHGFTVDTQKRFCTAFAKSAMEEKNDGFTNEKNVLRAPCRADPLRCARRLYAAVRAGRRLQIVATLFPQYDFARTLAGGRANVSLLLSPGADAHSFESSPKDISPSQARISLFTPETIGALGAAACWKARMWRARWSRAV